MGKFFFAVLIGILLALMALTTGFTKKDTNHQIETIEKRSWEMELIIWRGPTKLRWGTILTLMQMIPFFTC